MTAELRPVLSRDEWEAYHAIRRRVLFEARGLFDVYDDFGPDERAPGNHPLLLAVDGDAVGTIRVDLAGKQAIFRLVAIAEDRQRRGLGARMQQLAEAFAVENGADELIVHSAPEATGFYEKLGFTYAPPNADPHHPRMRKGLTNPTAPAI